MPRLKSTKPKENPVERLRRRYATYDPDVEGYGNPAQWKDAFEQTMGHDEALKVLGLDNPLTILGFDAMPTKAELKKRYRTLIMENHPDKGGNTVKAQRIIAAYSELKDKALD
jgi:hypothetical protein